MLLVEAGHAVGVRQDLLPATLARDGVVLIQEASVVEVRALLDRWTVPVGAPRLRTGDGDKNEAGFTELPLLPHTDRSLHAQPPSVLATLMLAPARAGGSATLVDGSRVLTLVRHRAEDATIAELRLREAAGRSGPPLVEFTPGHARIRYRDDRVAGPYSADGRTDLVAEFRRLIVDTTRSLHLGSGDGYLVHNHRFMHGRTAFTGDRSIVRFLARVNSDHPYAWLNRGFPFASS
ncbi:TauD/TfdA family dioxygenase [Micromonospora ureilytica]|uniref:TauD/TfdA family dioxygenase n=1 Tax=Micromonospora ureilytica TaxID=709868 RepID=UPI004039EC50